MFSAFRQLALRTVSSSSSTGRSRMGSNCVSVAFAVESSCPCRSTNTDSWSLRMPPARRIASSGSMVPLVSMSRISLSRSVRCSTRALSTLYVTLRTGLKEASSCRRPMARVCSSKAMRCAAGRYPRPRSTFSDIDNSPALVRLAITRSGFRISMSWSPEISPAVTGPGPFLCKRTSATSRVCMRMATALRFSRMSTTSSCTPSIAVYSWSTPSISISVIAAPGKDDSSTRRKALPSVCPKPRSNGSITIRAWRVDTGCTLTTRGFKNSVMDPCMEYLAKDFGHCAARAAMPPAGRREDALLGIQLDDQALVDVGQDLLPFGNSLQKTGELLVVHFDPVREAHLGRHREGRRYASLLLGFLAQVDHVAGLALVGG